MPNKRKILLTGGHAATTAISVIEELIRRYGKEAIDINWIGAGSSIEGKRVEGLELKILPKMGIKTHLIISGRLQRKFTRWTILSLIKIPIGFIHASFILPQIKPDVVLSFGGFAAFPVVVVSWLLRIPVVIHEQTATAGLANRLSAIFSRRVLLANESCKKYFPKKKCLVVGNPVMTQICEVLPKEKIGKPPTIFITAGSRGSQIINKAVYEILDKLIKNYTVIHITGEADYSRFAFKKGPRYEVYPWISPMKIDGIYKQADLVIARAGANTVSEIMVTKRPSLLIPIPWTYLNEQRNNAEVAREFGIARILEQDLLNGKKLWEEINEMLKVWQETVNKVANKESQDRNANFEVGEVLKEYLE